jgi:hypothetical protein
MASGDETEIARLARELNEALERQTATSELLSAIASSPNDAQPIFEMIAKSARRLCKAPIRPVHFTTINRWRKRGWAAVRSEHPLDTARAALDSAIPLITGQATCGVAELVEKGSEKVISSDSYRIAIVSRKPKEFSILFAAMAQCFVVKGDEPFVPAA